MNAQSNSPWLDQNGKLLSNEKIRSVSKEWPAETWERFLTSTVDFSESKYEDISVQYNTQCENEQRSVWGSPCSTPQVVKNEIIRAVQNLKKQPRKIIRCHYWKNMSLRKIGNLEKLPPSRVHKIKTDSLSKIKVLLEKSVNTPSYLIGGSKNFYLPKNREEEINEVYRVDLEGSYLK